MKQKNKGPKKLQTSILCVCLLTFAISFSVTAYLNLQNNRILGRIEDTYFSNQLLMKTQEVLQSIQNDVSTYLNTKSTDSLTDYYDKENAYRILLKSFNTKITEADDEVMEKNIYYMSETYLDMAGKAIQAKRGRDIESYRQLYASMTQQYDYLNAAIYTLNNQKFEKNSTTYSQIVITTKKNNVNNILLVSVVAVLNMLLLLVLTGRIMKPLKNLTDAARMVGTGNLELQLTETGRQDEVDVVIHAFNQMVSSLKTYIRDQQESLKRETAMKEKAMLAETHMKDAQLKYLRAQINPHFLFNTLNAAAQLAMMEEADGTYNYLHTVADFYRYAAKEDSGITTLQKEIALIDDYMYIINVRYSGEIHYEKQIDPEALDYRMPGMILQPIVENCIKHGVGELEGEKKIVLEVTCEGEQIVISVRDNGVGMDQKTIDQLLQVKDELQKTENVSKNGSIGMRNVLTRLRLYYDKTDIMEITSLGENMGTEVTLFLPAERSE